MLKFNPILQRRPWYFFYLRVVLMLQVTFLPYHRCCFRRSTEVSLCLFTTHFSFINLFCYFFITDFLDLPKPLQNIIFHSHRLPTFSLVPAIMSFNLSFDQLNLPRILYEKIASSQYLRFFHSAFVMQVQVTTSNCTNEKKNVLNVIGLIGALYK